MHRILLMILKIGNLVVLNVKKIIILNLNLNVFKEKIKMIYVLLLKIIKIYVRLVKQNII